MPKISELSLADSGVLTDTDYVPAVVGGVTKRMLLSELREEMQGGYSVLFHGAVADADAAGNGTDNTVAFQLAVNTAYSAGFSSVFVPDGIYSIAGTVELPPGITLYGQGQVGQYYDGFPMSSPAQLVKPSSGTNGAILMMDQCSAARNLSFKHLKVGGACTGVIQIGALPLTTNVTYSSITECFIIGVRTTDITGATTCYGIYFPESQSGYGRYYNHYSNLTITDCDIAVHLGGQGSGNIFANMTTRECHIHYELNSQASFCLENTLTGLGLFSVNTLSPATVCFRLIGAGTIRNNFICFNTETLGSCYSIDAACVGNKFLGAANEPANSYVPANNFDYDYAQPVNHSKQTQMLIPAVTTANRDVTGKGNSMKFLEMVSGTLPQTGRAAGTLAAADVNCKSIVQFPGLYTKSSLISMRVFYRIYTTQAGTVGTGVNEGVFYYRNRNSGTGAGELDVKSFINESGTVVTGLWFLTGVAGSTNFGIAIVGGNNGAPVFDSIICELDITALDYGSSAALTMVSLAGLTFVSTALTANDVTNGISLLTVANTVV